MRQRHARSQQHAHASAPDTGRRRRASAGLGGYMEEVRETRRGLARAVEQTTSLWMATASVPAFAPLREDAEADVCVVGGGIAGLTTAYLLTRAGRKVVVLDDGPVGGGQTQRTTAHLSCAIDDRYYEIERLRGTGGARLAAESHRSAIDHIEAIVRREAIACDFERLDGYLVGGPGQDPALLERERAAAERAGLTGIELLERAPVEPYDFGPCLRFPRQGQFHPLKYLAALAQAVAREGGRIHGQTHAARIRGGRAATVETVDGRTVRARAAVVATNSPVNNTLVVPLKQSGYMTYVIGARIPPGAFPHALLWDTLDPYHYLRRQRAARRAGRPSHDIVLIGGEDHRTGDPTDAAGRFARLEAWARERLPAMREVEFRWSGQVMETFDGLAFIGRNPLDADNVYIATGDSGMGMTHGTIAGMLLTDMILGRASPWAPLYDPARTPARAVLGEGLRADVTMATQYRDWMTAGQLRSAADIPRGGGAVLRRGLRKIAAYRDEAGGLHEYSAVCPHLRGIVRWNDGEKTWDCPCHSSRFDCYGKVIQGPANSDLAPARVKP